MQVRGAGGERTHGPEDVDEQLHISRALVRAQQRAEQAARGLWRILPHLLHARSHTLPSCSTEGPLQCLGRSTQSCRQPKPCKHWTISVKRLMAQRTER